MAVADLEIYKVGFHLGGHGYVGVHAHHACAGEVWGHAPPSPRKILKYSCSETAFDSNFAVKLATYYSLLPCCVYTICNSYTTGPRARAYISGKSLLAMV